VLLVLAMAGLLRPSGGDTALMPLGVAAAAGEGAGPAVSTRPAAIAEPREPAPPPAPDGAFRPGDLGQALEHYRAALAEKPADAELLDNVGQVLVAMKRPAEAVPFLKQAVGVEPSNMTARFDLAVAHARSGQIKEAVDEYHALVQAGSADVRVHHNLGLALRQLGRHAEAATAFERATVLAPGEAPSWLGLALSLEAESRAGDAAAALDRYLSLEPDTADADNVRARIGRLRAVVEPSSPPTEPGGASTRRRP
jgi:tetratricopeptide (TPR) repeat protein